MNQTIQVIGSILILVAYALSQRGVVDQKSQLYLALNIIGSAALAVEAVVEHQYGFILLEAIWALLSTVSLFGVLRGQVPSPHPRHLPRHGLPHQS